MALAGSQQVLPSGEEASMLRGLPLAALRLEAATLEGLAQAGLKKAGDIMDLPRAPLARRFGPDVLSRLDQAWGVKASRSRRACRLQPSPPSVNWQSR